MCGGVGERKLAHFVEEFALIRKVPVKDIVKTDTRRTVVFLNIRIGFSGGFQERLSQLLRLIIAAIQRFAGRKAG